MPCVQCNRTLAYHEEKHSLYCPNCLDLPVADRDFIKEVASKIRKENLNNQTLARLIQEHGSLRVIAELTNRLNQGAGGLVSKNRMPFGEFFHATPIIKTIYENSNKFEHTLESGTDASQQDFRKNVNTLLDAGTTLIAVLKQTEEDFTIPIKLLPDSSTWEDFYSDNLFLHSEYWLCAERCTRANAGARDELREDFMLKEIIFRNFDRPEYDEYDSVEEWADSWYGFIVEIGFASALDQNIGEIFTTDFPDSVSIFDLESLFDKVNNFVSNAVASRSDNEFHSNAIPRHVFEEFGEDVFGGDWEKVRSLILMSSANPDAHPLFFEWAGTRSIDLYGEKDPDDIVINHVIYPDLFSQLLKFQLFPFLNNGQQRKSTAVLEDLTAKRGKEFERHVFEYLRDTPKTKNAYHSCKTSKQNGHEIDAIFEYEDTVYFVEVKFVLPTLNMQSQVGIQSVNSKFDRKIFKEADDTTGKPFPEKVQNYRDLEPGETVSHQISENDDDREQIQVPHEWIEADHEMLVVSNFVPSYITKKGVQFLTDLELYQWIENGENVFCDTITPNSLDI
ncbi:hypothetical protein [Halorubrum tebenquichense]|uniref:hypothetical protein n=1 Tax=Halorubrum tebenquichense TaxID=119434 RepID=UPI000B30FAF4|nr:hypothetical protein [Halorubrum tebenquichense]